MASFLFAGLHPTGRGGVSSWISTVAAELRILGHDTAIWRPGTPLPRRVFDYGILANQAHTVPAALCCREVLNVSHGIIPEERPLEYGEVAFTSEEVRDHWRRAGSILRQPIDLTFWAPSEAARSHLTFYSYRSPNDLGLAQVAESLGLAFCWLKDVSWEQARAQLQRSAVAVASGRAALEAMACGAATVLADWRAAYQPALMMAEAEKGIETNYSGRGGVAVTIDRLTAAAQLALSTQDPHGWIAAHHDARKITEDLLCLLS